MKKPRRKKHYDVIKIGSPRPKEGQFYTEEEAQELYDSLTYQCDYEIVFIP